MTKANPSPKTETHWQCVSAQNQNWGSPLFHEYLDTYLKPPVHSVQLDA